MCSCRCYEMMPLQRLLLVGNHVGGSAQRRTCFLSLSMSRVLSLSPSLALSRPLSPSLARSLHSLALFVPHPLSLCWGSSSLTLSRSAHGRCTRTRARTHTHAHSLAMCPSRPLVSFRWKQNTWSGVAGKTWQRQHRSGLCSPMREGLVVQRLSLLRPKRHRCRRHWTLLHEDRRDKDYQDE